MPEIKTLLLFVLTAVAEIVGCYLPWLWLKQGGSAWLLLPAAVSLALFVWLLTLHPSASGRIYAAYGGIYIIASIGWLAVVERIRPLGSDWIGVALCVIGASVILFGPRFAHS